ncbi:hypothetical protein BDU57DRAFT_508654 [Ampelomyces quisqualis]|uniref:Uncharacterized protein n=1 Tax=Ampelomyces quisqualis TaxID=50730 RepID=A0A6A5QX61_AMPQU|nr:hypothetical protein BDU57DRAFT_508654 [Ampelomyces quisqualis]
MSPNSSVFVDSEYETEAGARPRARPNERYDFLKEQGRLNELEQDRQMVRYRDRNYFGATQQRLHAGTDRLAVPVYEERRRPRAHSDTRSRNGVDELSRGFRTLEVRPSAELVSRRNESKDRVEVSEVLRGSNQSRDPVEKPKIKIPPLIVQEHPQVSNPGKVSSASPRSPNGQPQLQLKYLVLQNKLADVSLSCIRYLDVEASNPRDLTFEKISEQVKGFAFDLHVWSHLTNIQSMARSNVPEDSKAVADAASRKMDRLNQTTKELHDACLDAKPGDLKVEELGKVADEDNMFDNVDDER